MARSVLRSRRAFAGLVAAGALAVALMGSTPAQAVGKGAGSCVFSGLTGNLNPPIPVIGGKDLTGTYTLNGVATCVAAEGAAAQAPVSVNIVSAGSYYNLQCGTGWLTGETPIGQTIFGQVGGPPSPFFPIVASGGSVYEIAFVNGPGPLRFGQGTAQTRPDRFGQPLTGVWKDGAGDVLTGGGEASLIPANGGGCVTQPVVAFQVNGSFHAEA